MIEVIYPYVKNAAKGDELKHSIRSIDRYLQGEYRITVIGDKPDFINDKVRHIPHDRVPGVPLTNCYDVNCKMNKVLLDNDIGEQILWMYDDIYLLRDCTINDFAVPHFAMSDLFKVDRVEGRKHQRLIWSTFDVLKKTKDFKHIYNGETHMPRYFYKSKMLKVYKKYKPIRNRLLIFTLYLNHFKVYERPIMLSTHEGVMAYLYGYDDKEKNHSHLPKNKAEVQNLMRSNVVLNHNNAGYSEPVKEALTTRFSEPSKYEKS